MAKIPGGYYIKARVFDNSAIAHKSPIYRILWDWLYGHAAHMPYRKYGMDIVRGQLLITYGQVQEATFWMVGNRKKIFSKPQISKALRWFKDEKMVKIKSISEGNAEGNAKATPKATQTAGNNLVVTICNYNYYQNPKNYEKDAEGNAESNAKATPKETAFHIIDKNYNKNRERESIGLHQYVKKRYSREPDSEIDMGESAPGESAGWSIYEDDRAIKDSQGHDLTLYAREINPDAIGRPEEYHAGFIARWYCDICRKQGPAKESELDEVLRARHEAILKKIKENGK